MNSSTPVIIVGGGPCGLMLAIELGCRSVPCVLLEAQVQPPSVPKANATSARTMEHFRRRGFSRAVRAVGLTEDHPNDIVYCTRLNENELTRFRIPSRRDAGNLLDFGDYGESAWPTPELPHRAQQMLIEPILRAQARQYDAVQALFGWRVVSVSREGDHGIVHARCEASGEERGFRSPYVVGCDGPRSLVRKAMGVNYEGASKEQRDFFGGQMLTLYFRSPDLYERLGIGAQRRAAWMTWVMNPQQRGLFFAINGVDEFALGIQLKPGQTVADVDVDGVFRAVTARDIPAHDKPFTYTLLNKGEWTAGYTLVAERFREGPLFIAGDAAHLFTPTGGMGYNTSVDDAVNLGWKLAACVQGWAGPALLDTYHQERHPMAHRNTRFARTMADSIGRIPMAPGLELDNAEGAQARQQLGQALAQHVAREFNIPGLTLGLRYESGIVAKEAGPAPVDEPNRYLPSAYPGARAPHWAVGDNKTSVLDRFGREFTLLVLNPDLVLEAFSQQAQALAVPVTLLRISNDAERLALRELYGADLALIRPDHHIAWRGNDPDQASGFLPRAIGCQTDC